MLWTLTADCMKHITSLLVPCDLHTEGNIWACTIPTAIRVEQKTDPWEALQSQLLSCLGVLQVRHLAGPLWTMWSLGTCCSFCREDPSSILTACYFYILESLPDLPGMNQVNSSTPQPQGLLTPPQQIQGLCTYLNHTMYDMVLNLLANFPLSSIDSEIRTGTQFYSTFF